MKYVLKTIGVLFLMGLTISLGSYLEALHSNVFNMAYDGCKTALIKADNYQSVHQAAKCAEDHSVELRVLGTILFREGSYLE